MKSTRLCLACGNALVPLLHVPRQRYCSSKACQRARRRDWQKNRLRTDSDYRDNQARAQAQWRAGHSSYWREYRAAHPAYRQRNRSMQRTQCTAEFRADCKHGCDRVFAAAGVGLLHTV
ncbi:hypothetical protein OKW42_006528 [Paraburkholderia sp. WC7.3d]